MAQRGTAILIKTVAASGQRTLPFKLVVLKMVGAAFRLRLGAPSRWRRRSIALYIPIVIEILIIFTFRFHFVDDDDIIFIIMMILIDDDKLLAMIITRGWRETISPLVVGYDEDRW